MEFNIGALLNRASMTVGGLADIRLILNQETDFLGFVTGKPFGAFFPRGEIRPRLAWMPKGNYRKKQRILGIPKRLVKQSKRGNGISTELLQKAIGLFIT